MDPLQKLADFFIAFPGVGKRQAQRFVHFLLHQDPETRSSFAKLVEKLSDEVTQCTHCMRFFIGRETEKTVCTICDSSSRNSDLLMVVEKDTDLDTIEETGVYKGYYFVIGGLLPIMENGAQEPTLYSNELKKRITKLRPKEVVVALAATPEGARTTEHIRDVLRDFKGTISTLGRGLSTGVELEYSDKETIESAFTGRTQSN